MDDYTVLIIATLVGFLALAALLLVPVYRFLDREKEVSEKWTDRSLAERMQQRGAGQNGSESDEEKDRTQDRAQGSAPDAPR